MPQVENEDAEETKETNKEDATKREEKANGKRKIDETEVDDDGNGKKK